MRVPPKTILWYSAGAIFGVFVFLNIISSQIISPLYGSVVNSNKKATVMFIKKLIGTAYFPPLLSEAKVTFGPTILVDIYQEAFDRKARITELEEVLKKNTNAKEVLIELSVLYKKDGNEKKSLEYIKQAAELDPMVRN